MILRIFRTTVLALLFFGVQADLRPLQVGACSPAWSTYSASFDVEYDHPNRPATPILISSSYVTYPTPTADSGCGARPLDEDDLCGFFPEWFFFEIEAPGLVYAYDSQADLELVIYSSNGSQFKFGIPLGDDLTDLENGFHTVLHSIDSAGRASDPIVIEIARGSTRE